MNSALLQRQPKSLLDDSQTMRKLALNHSRNKAQDHTRLMDQAAAAFRYEDCRNEMWNPEQYSLLFGTPLWEQSTPAQRVLLNQLYWVAYYAQIISAEIATILLNQTAGAGLYTLEDFRAVCDTLDLESAQERAHINAFKTVAEEVEEKVFGERIFTYPMRSMYAQTMVFADTNAIKDMWRNLQLRFYTQLSAGNAFIGCQYFTVRGIRTLNGKIVQHALSRYYTSHPDQDNAPIPSKISYFHFMDESYHFNSSGIVSHDVVKTLKAPTAFERMVANKTLAGCQEDHFHFSSAINGIFWYDPALFGQVYKILRSPSFGLDDAGARQMLEACFARDNDGVQASYKTHREAVASYKAYLADLSHVSAHNKEMRRMSASDIPGYLSRNRAALARFPPVSAKTYEVDFGSLGKVDGRLPHGAALSEVLTIENSPLLFGCRTGICGTCLAKVEARSGELLPPTEDEKDVLSLLCPNEPKARLACQIKLSADLTIEPIKLTRD